MLTSDRNGDAWRILAPDYLAHTVKLAQGLIHLFTTYTTRETHFSECDYFVLRTAEKYYLLISDQPLVTGTTWRGFNKSRTFIPSCINVGMILYASGPKF